MKAPVCRVWVGDKEGTLLTMGASTYGRGQCERGLHALLFLKNPDYPPTSPLTRVIHWYRRPDGLTVLRIMGSRIADAVVDQVYIECGNQHTYNLNHGEIIEIY